MNINILVFPCGSHGAIEIHSALKEVTGITLFGASGKDDHGRFIYKNYIDKVPYITESNFILFLTEIIKTYKIDIIIPTHDEISLFLARNNDVINCKIAVPGLKQAEICRSKILTYDLFKGESFCPVVYEHPDEINTFPIFAKPDKGQGGKGTYTISGMNDPILNEAVKRGLILMEFLPGEEFTVDCFSDRHGKLRFIGPRKRNRIFCGISTSSFTVPLTFEIETVANRICEKIKMRGLWYFQLKRAESGTLKLIEVSVRVSGTMCLYRGLGINFPLLTVHDLMGHEIENIISNDYYLEVDRALFNRYKCSVVYDTIYIDLDDIIGNNGLVKPYFILFIYHSKNNGKKIKLFVREEYNLNELMDKLCIYPNLFDEIMPVSLIDNKYKHIPEKEKVIFIDSNMKERFNVNRELHIPVFDIDAISTLINWAE